MCLVESATGWKEAPIQLAEGKGLQGSPCLLIQTEWERRSKTHKHRVRAEWWWNGTVIIIKNLNRKVKFYELIRERVCIHCITAVN